MAEPLLHGFWRSTATYRVRIAMNLKGIGYADAAHHLRRGDHRTADYLALNPQGLLPALETDGAVLTQSLAICEYLDETHPEPPLLPAEPLARAQVRALAPSAAPEPWHRSQVPATSTRISCALPWNASSRLTSMS